MFGFIGKIGKGFALIGKLQKIHAEGKDVVVAVAKFQDKYDDLPDDLKEAWKELEEFFEAVRAVV